MTIPTEVDVITDALKKVVISKLETNKKVSSEQKDLKKPSGKLGKIVDLMLRAEGATIQEMVDATSWQKHSVRGAISGQIKKKWKYTVEKSMNSNSETVYHLAG